VEAAAARLQHGDGGGSRAGGYNTNTTITNITPMVVPFAPHTAWDQWIRPIEHV